MKHYDNDVKVLWKDRKRYFGLPISFTRYALIQKPGKWVKLVVEKGLFYTEREEVNIYRIDDLSAFQNLFHKFFCVGNITIYCKDASSDKVVLQKIANPYKVYALINEIVESERNRKKMSYSEFQV